MKPRQRLEELLTGDANLLRFAGFHSGFDGLREPHEFRWWRQGERGDAVAAGKGYEFCFRWRRVGEHGIAIGVSKISGVPGDSIFYLQELTQCRWERRRQFLPGEYLASGAKSCGSDAAHDPIPVFEQVRAAGIE